MSSASSHRDRDRPIRHAAGESTLLLLPGLAYDVRTRFDRGAFGFAFEAQWGEDAFGSDVVRPFHRRPNTLSWLPPGSDVYSSSPAGGEYLVLEAPDAAAGVSEAAYRAARQRRFNDAVDPDVVAAARAMRRALLGGREPDAFAIEEWLDTMRAALEARLTGPHPDAHAWLTPARLQQIDQLIDARMAEGPSVAEMAGHIGLSVGFFIRAFKRALGVTPHAYLLDKRLARARRELDARSASIAEIAHACGFTHQSHMTAVMRRELGVTPAAYRER